MNTLEWLLFMDDDEFLDLLQRIKSSISEDYMENCRLIDLAVQIRAKHHVSKITDWQAELKIKTEKQS